MSTGIQWTDETWNPVTGCAKVSPGCAHCYAENTSMRFWDTQYQNVPDGKGGTRGRVFEDVWTHPDRLKQPLKWKRPRKVFVNSMSDLFHEDVPDSFIDQVFAVMGLASQHTFQVLTKRAERMRDYLQRLASSVKPLESAARGLGYTLQFEGLPLLPWPIPNVWIGVSVENQHFADERIPLLCETPAAVRFLSVEPQLGPVEIIPDYMVHLDWVIVGGESGPQARPFEVTWAHSLVEQCLTAGVYCFVKQLGAKPMQRVMYGPAMFEADQPTHLEPMHLKDRKGGDIDEWPEDLRVREFPA